MPAPSPKLRFLGKLIAGLIIGVMAVSISLAIIRPQPVRAFFGEAIAAAIWKEIKDQLREIRRDIKAKLGRVAKISADVAFKNSLRVFAGKLAEDTATWIASAGTGQKPLFITDKKYFTKLADAAAGDFLDTYAKDLFGANICNPADIQKKLRILQTVEGLTLPSPIESCQKRCREDSTKRQQTVQQIEQARAQAEKDAGSERQTGSPIAGYRCNVNAPPGANANTRPDEYEWGPPGVEMSATQCATTLAAIINKERARDANQVQQCLRQCSTGQRKAACTATEAWRNLDAAKLTAQVNVYFDPGENDIGQILRIYGAAQQRREIAVGEERVLIESRIRPTTTKVTDEATSPSAAVEKKLKQAIEESTAAEKVYTGSLAADIVRIFTNTLTQRLTERFFKGKCGLNPAACRGPGQATSPAGSLLVSTLTGVAAAKLQFASLGQIDYISGDASQTEDVFPLLRNRGLVVDERLAQAVNEKKTVKEALEVGLLDGEKTFGFDLQGNEPPDGYPYRLILYLRHYRVVPVGWELAAQHLKNFDRRDIGLNDLVKLYDQRTVKDGAGRDVPNAYYGLIDPNWVLKLPSTLCKRRGAGEEIVTRRFVCDQDNNALGGQAGTINCGPQGNDVGRWILSRNTDYCTDEQSCIAENDDGSCRQFGYCFAEKRVWRFGGTSCPNYYASCTAYTSQIGQDVAYLANTTDQQGCSSDNAGCRWYCDDPAGPDANGRWSCAAGTTTNRLYLDRDAEQCSEAAAGCTEFLGAKDGANIAANGSFEYFSGTLDDGQPDTFGNWLGSGEAVRSDNSFVTNVQNEVALETSAAIDGTYRSSAPLAGRPFSLSFYGRTVGGTSCGGSVDLQIGGHLPAAGLNPTYGPSWQRFVVTAPSVPSGTPLTDEVRYGISASCTILVDNVQLEEGSTATAYRDYGAANRAYLTNRKLSCAANEVGCELYTSVTTRQRVPGVVTDVNRCPASAVGCKAFREMPIDRIPQRPATDPVYLIPATGSQCPALAVGCEEYTNLDIQARGGEAREYFSYLKQCVRPDQIPGSQATFYSWVGSESRGFELKTYRLVRSTVDPGPCTNLSVGSAGADPSCTDTAATLGSCSPVDLQRNPDCTEFFSADGAQVFYRLRSRVITVTETCHPARNTNDQAAGLDRIYMIAPEESLRCSGHQANCREYKGNAGNNTRLAFQDSFDDGDALGWQLQSGGGPSNESVTVGGHSLRLVSGTSAIASDTIRPQLTEGKSYLLSLWARTAVNQAAPELQQVFFDNGNAAENLALVASPGQDLSTQWNLYRLGPVFFGRAVGASERLTFIVNGDIFLDSVVLTEITDSVFLIKGSARSCQASEANCERYTDRANRPHTLTGFSNLCSEDKVGCQELINTQNSTRPDQFTVRGVVTPADVSERWVVSTQARCQAQDKGCTRLGRPTLDANGQLVDWATVSLKKNPDRFEQILCQAGEEFCTEYTSKIDGSKHYFRDPGERTCSYARRPGESEFRWLKTGTTEDCPSIKLIDRCERRSVAGVDQFCYASSPEGTCQSCLVRACEAEESGCNEYRDPSDPTGCRIDCPLEIFQGKPQTVNQFCSPQEPRDGGIPGCRSYTYLKQSVEGTAAECGQQVNLTEGCRPFFDTSNPNRNFRGG